MLSQHAPRETLAVGLVASVLAISGLTAAGGPASAAQAGPDGDGQPAAQLVRTDVRIAAKVRPTRVYARRTHSRLKVRVYTPGRQVYGHVVIAYRGFWETARLRDGRLTFHHLGVWPKAGQKRVWVRYVGTKRFNPEATVVKLRVRKR